MVAFPFVAPGEQSPGAILLVEAIFLLPPFVAGLLFLAAGRSR
jgi:hypothetical protein